MAVPVTEFKRLDAPHAGLDSIAHRAATGTGESGLATCFHNLYSSWNRGAEKASRAR